MPLTTWSLALLLHAVLPVLLLLAATGATGTSMARLRLPHHGAHQRVGWQLHRPTVPRRRGLTQAAAATSSGPTSSGPTDTPTGNPTASPSQAPTGSPTNMLSVKIVGGGLAGLSTAWHLVSSNNGAASIASITILDPRPPGQAEASSVAGGLLHPLTPKNKLIWAGREGFQATVALLAASKAALERAGDSAAVARLHSAPGSILRPALTPQHEADYQVAAAKLPEWLQWLEGDAWRARARAGASSAERPNSGLLLKGSVIISMADYLRGLWLSLEQQQQEAGSVAVRWEQATAPSLSELLGGSSQPCDALVVASGAGIRGFSELQDLPVELVRGRTLLVEDEAAAPLPAALLCGEYVVPGVDAAATADGPRRVLRCGATREYIKDPWARPPEADGEGGPELLEALRRKAEVLHPGLVGGRAAYGVTTGTRVAAKRSNLGKLPILGRVPLPGGETRVWLYTGLGGRGMIHHAYLGGCLARAIVADDDAVLPKELRVALEALR